jgi:hypothetical protein
MRANRRKGEPPNKGIDLGAREHGASTLNPVVGRHMNLTAAQ